MEPKSTTDGGCAKGMPRNLFTPPAVAPKKVPSSSVTIGPPGCAAKTVAVAAQMITSDAQRKATGITGRED